MTVYAPLELLRSRDGLRKTISPILNLYIDMARLHANKHPLPSYMTDA